MGKFYFTIWLKWAIYLSVSSIVWATIFSSLVTLFIYINQGSVALSTEVYQALFKIVKFWFPLVWSVTLLVALFRALKIVFNRCYNGYEMKLLQCMKEGQSETIEIVGYGDVKSVWRKWLMLLIWLVGAQMILAFIFTRFFTSYEAVFAWFSIYLLYAFVLIGGYFSFILLSSRCRLVKVKRC